MTLARRSAAPSDGADEIDQLAEAVLVQRGAGVVLGQDAFKARILALDGNHGVVGDLTEGRLFGIGLQVGPAGVGGDSEDVFGLVFVFILGVGPLVFTIASDELGAMLLESVVSVFEEDKTEHDVLVFSGIQVRSELVGS
nr:hypothetical protein [Cerasicoccus frondis]